MARQFKLMNECNRAGGGIPAFAAITPRRCAGDIRVPGSTWRSGTLNELSPCLGMMMLFCGLVHFLAARQAGTRRRDRETTDCNHENST